MAGNRKRSAGILMALKISSPGNRISDTTTASTNRAENAAGDGEAMKKFSPATQVDFVIIGSGGAGGAMAKELSTSGFEVVVLEQGPRLETKDFQHAELKIRSTP